jgi:hypothetical protein
VETVRWPGTSSRSSTTSKPERLTQPIMSSVAMSFLHMQPRIILATTVIVKHRWNQVASRASGFFRPGLSDLKATCQEHCKLFCSSRISSRSLPKLEDLIGIGYSDSSIYPNSWPSAANRGPRLCHSAVPVDRVRRDAYIHIDRIAALHFGQYDGG